MRNGAGRSILTSLYIGGNGTTIGGTQYVGSISRVDPNTGVSAWRTGLPGEVIGSPAINGVGVLAAPIMGSGSGSGVVLVNASTGSILTTLPSTSPVFSQPIFANGMLFVVAGTQQTHNHHQGIDAFAPTP